MDGKKKKKRRREARINKHIVKVKMAQTVHFSPNVKSYIFCGNYVLITMSFYVFIVFNKSIVPFRFSFKIHELLVELCMHTPKYFNTFRLEKTQQ